MEELLRADRLDHGGAKLLAGRGALYFVVLSGALYGVTMGAFAFDGSRWPQLVFSAVKVPMLFGVTMMLAIPIYYVLNAQRGVASDFRSVLRLLVEYQMRVVTVLVALAPITALLNLRAPETGYGWIQLWNTFAFALAAVLAQRKLTIAYQPLIRAQPKHRALLRSWTLLYAFIGIQMAWTLRPFVGSPQSPSTFLREGKLQNAYSEIFAIFAGLFG